MTAPAATAPISDVQIPLQVVLEKTDVDSVDQRVQAVAQTQLEEISSDEESSEHVQKKSSSFFSRIFNTENRWKIASVISLILLGIAALICILVLI
jgi:hypothetical protein